VAFFEEKYAGIGRFAYQQLRETEWIGSIRKLAARDR
jgi:hypothetical protein